MSGQSMADVLAGHEMENSPVIRGEGYTRCSCGFLSKGAYSRAAHNRHVSDSLSAAGFGPVREAAAAGVRSVVDIWAGGGGRRTVRMSELYEATQSIATTIDGTLVWHLYRTPADGQGN